MTSEVWQEWLVDRLPYTGACFGMISKRKIIGIYEYPEAIRAPRVDVDLGIPHETKTPSTTNPLTPYERFPLWAFPWGKLKTDQDSLDAIQLGILRP